MISIIGYMVGAVGINVALYIFARAVSVKLEDTQGFAKLAWWVCGIVSVVTVLLIFLMLVALDEASKKPLGY